MNKHLFLLAFVWSFVFIACNKDEINNLEERVDGIETVSISELKQELQQADTKIATLKAELDALENQLASGDTDLESQLASLRADLETAQTDFTAACNAAIAAAIEANNEVIKGAIADSLNVARTEWQTDIGAIDAQIATIGERLSALENRIQSLTYLPRYNDGCALVTGDGILELEFVVSPAALADSIVAEWGREENTYAFFSTTAVRTRAATPKQQEISDVTVSSPGIITVKVSAYDFPASFFRGDSTAVVYIRYADGNNDVVSEMIPVVSSLGEITDPAQVVSGDIALLDGTFMPNLGNWRGDRFTYELTDIQQKHIAGVVFWTTADVIPQTTPCSLTDDKIMNADFPHCTHGLIVALNDIESSMMSWQENVSSVYGTQPYALNNGIYNPNTSDYVAVESGTSSSDPINFIYGYNNTKIIKVFNDSYRNIEGRTVLPVDMLDEFDASNPAPKNSTGWFIPSVKELVVLYAYDVDDVYNENSLTYSNGAKVDQILTWLEDRADKEVDLLGDRYWSSTEYDDGEAYYVGRSGRGAATTVIVTWDYKRYDGDMAQGAAVRAICAF